MAEPCVVSCACGGRWEGAVEAAVAGYRAHRCPHYDPAGALNPLGDPVMVTCFGCRQWVGDCSCRILPDRSS